MEPSRLHSRTGPSDCEYLDLKTALASSSGSPQSPRTAVDLVGCCHLDGVAFGAVA